MTISIETSDSALMAMTQYDWITYLTTNRMCLAIKETLLANQYLFQVLNQSIYDYRRDDFTSRELPALCIYEPEDDIPSRFYPTNGTIIFDIYLPIKLTRRDTSAVFNTLSREFVNILQSQPFWYGLIDRLVPLPPPSSQIYEDVIRYKTELGSPLVDFAKKCRITAPNKIELLDIGDVWKLQIKTEYNFDMSNYYAMLEDFGINADVDPNKIVYQIFQDFSVKAEPLGENI